MIETTKADVWDCAGIMQHLAGISNLKDGWYEDGGKELDKVGLAWLNYQLHKHFYTNKIPMPRIYPTPGNGIILEWTIGVHELSIEIDLKTHRAEWHNMNMSTNEVDTMTFDLNTLEGWELVVSEYKKIEDSQ